MTTPSKSRKGGARLVEAAATVANLLAVAWVVLFYLLIQGYGMASELNWVGLWLRNIMALAIAGSLIGEVLPTNKRVILYACAGSASFLIFLVIIASVGLLFLPATGLWGLAISGLVMTSAPQAPSPQAETIR